MDLKSSKGWINAMTPPLGFTIDSNTGFATPSHSIILAIQTASINQVSHNMSPPPLPPPPPFIQIPPPPPPLQPPAPPITNNNAGASFSRQGSHQRDGASIISAVSINGQPYTGNV